MLSVTHYCSSYPHYARLSHSPNFFKLAVSLCLRRITRHRLILAMNNHVTIFYTGFLCYLAHIVLSLPVSYIVASNSAASPVPQKRSVAHSYVCRPAGNLQSQLQYYCNIAWLCIMCLRNIHPTSGSVVTVHPDATFLICLFKTQQLTNERKGSILRQDEDTNSRAVEKPDDVSDWRQP